MLIFQQQKFVKAPFNNEVELEKVIFNNYEYLFGPDSFYLPKTKIKTADGSGTIPDGFAIDIGQKKWYVVEAELGHHPVWDHIARQVSKQIVAAQQLQTKQALEDISVDLYTNDGYVREKYVNLNVAQVDVRKVIREILESDPIIAIPIDSIPNDLKDWARQQRLKVKLWIVNKFVEFTDKNNIIYEFPEEFKPALDTEEDDKPKNISSEITQYAVGLYELVSANLLKVSDKLHMTYKPRNGDQKKYEATVLPDGSLEFMGQVYGSPSYAALAGIQKAGSDRQTVNGWTSWKTSDGRALADIRQLFLNTLDN